MTASGVSALHQLVLLAVHPWTSSGQRWHEGVYAQISPGGITKDERLLFSDGTWHRGQRSRVAFETACYYSHEPELRQGCQYSASQTQEWALQTYRASEREALAIIYQSLQGHQWRYNDNWNYGDPCWDFWYGVTCDEHGYVIYLEMCDNKLKGQIPENINQLTHLLKIDLSSTEEVYMGHKNKYINRIEGEFPSIKDLKAISEIEISGNLIEALPPDLYENADTLRVISASRNLLTSFPKKLYTFAHVHTFELARNHINQAFPSEDIQYMTNLRTLSFEYNSINGTITQDIERLQRMEVFDVSHNRGLRGNIPESIIVQWTETEYISIMNTTIDGYIAALCIDVPFCWKFMYDTHKDLTWATAADVPDLVNITMEIAVAPRRRIPTG